MAASENARSLAQKLLEWQGYVIVASTGQYKVGQSVSGPVGCHLGRFDAVLKIQALATPEDWINQHIRMGLPGMDNAPYYYKVVAE